MKTASQLMPRAAQRLEEAQQKWEPTRECPTCKGTGKRVGYQSNDEINCYSCKGDGLFPRPHLMNLIDEVTTVRKGKISVRSTRPERTCTLVMNRAYYVWRLARFDGGVDVTMPVIASMELGDDPYRKELDALASVVATMFFGTDKAGSIRWGRVLGLISEDDARNFTKIHPQPMTAEPCGPVVIGKKPEIEIHEMY